MKTLNDKIKNALEHDLVGELKEYSKRDIEQILENSTLIKGIDPDTYDAILISTIDPESLNCGWGYIFNDTRNRFTNGQGIRTSTIKEIASVMGGVKLITTRNTRYLTIEV